VAVDEVLDADKAQGIVNFVRKISTSSGCQHSEQMLQAEQPITACCLAVEAGLTLAIADKQVGQQRRFSCSHSKHWSLHSDEHGFLCVRVL
jgi:hypothetical protein